jgi:hypothetical protein
MNPIDKISIDIPLFIRMLEYAKEDAKTDMDLHKVTENAIKLSTSGKVLGMNDYDSIIGVNECGGEMKMEKGGTALDKDMLDDIAWDIAIQHQFIENDKWKNDDMKAKAYKLAELELMKYGKGGKAKAVLTGGGIDWLVTGE